MGLRKPIWISVLIFASSPSATTGWIPTGKLNAAREGHSATLLADGRVLVFGGSSTTLMVTPGGWTWFADAVPKNSAEIYDPRTGIWRSTGNLNVATSAERDTLLPTGEVLVTDGSNAEVYDPVTERWRPTANLVNRRAGHTATLLHNGRVLVAGGASGGDSRTGYPGSVHSAELYDPVTGSWSTTGSTSVVSSTHTATLLPDGKVLAIGNHDCVRAAELYDPATGSWSQTPTPPVYGCAERSVLLANGQVLVTEGAQAQLYDPATGRWSATAGPMLAGSRHTLTLLPNGQVLAAGGRNEDWSVDGAELYDPGGGTWTAAEVLRTPRATHTATRLPNGQVLVAAGFNGSCCDVRLTLDTADLFDLSAPGPQTVTTLSAASYRVAGLAPESIAVSIRSGLARTSDLAGTTVKVKDSAGIERLAPVFHVSAEEVRYQIPTGTAPGVATLAITSEDGTVSTAVLQIREVSPSLFTANGDGQGVAAAVVRRRRTDGSFVEEPVASFVAERNHFVPTPIDLGSPTDRVSLILSGTGIRFRNPLATALVTIGGTYGEIISIRPDPENAGVDRVEVLLPGSLAGRGEVDVLLTVDAQIANPVRIFIQ